MIIVSMSQNVIFFGVVVIMFLAKQAIPIHSDTREDFGITYTAGETSNGIQISFCTQDYFRGCVDVSYNEISTPICYTKIHLVDEVTLLRDIWSINLRGTCLIIYDRIGCTGESKTVSPLEDCHMALVNCGWDSRIRSFSLCNARILPPSPNSISWDGRPCVTECDAANKDIFTCNTTHSNSLCFPHPQQNMNGRYCQGICQKPEFWDTANAVIYDDTYFEGRGAELMLNRRKPCVNIPLEYLGVSGSLTSKGHCLWMFISRDCTGTRSMKVNQSMLYTFDNSYQSIGLCNFSQSVNTFINPGLKSKDKSAHWLPVVSAAGNNASKRMVIENNTCMNLLLNFPESRLRINNNGHCLNAFEHVGCSGKFVNLTRAHFTFQPNLSYYSIMHCTSSLRPLYEQPQSSSGKQCLTKCSLDPRTRAFFICGIGADDGWDFCSPRQGMDHFGNTCASNCVQHKLPETVTLYEKANFTGNLLKIINSENKICHNFRGSSSWLNRTRFASVDLHRNCIYLYKGIACTGDFELLLGNYEHWVSRFLMRLSDPLGNYKSLRFCTDGLPPESAKQCGISGVPCLNKCMERNESYPTCTIGNSTSEPCFPRDGFDLLGETVCPDCGCGNKGNPLRIALFENFVFKGRRVAIRQADLRHCYNLEFDPETNYNFRYRSLSLRLFGGNCIRVHDKIGCSGLNATVHADWHNMTKCPNPNGCDRAEWRYPESLSLCDGRLPIPYEQPLTLSGNNCSNQCVARIGAFKCATNVHYVEFCISRPDLNHIGQQCGSGDNCVFKKPKKTANILSSEIVVLEKNQTCHDIVGDNQNATLNVRPDLEIRGTCMFLYDRIGCSGTAIKIPDDSTNPQCKTNGTCSLHNVSSVRFCDAYLPELYQLALSYSGKLCRSTCTPSTLKHFTCQLHDGSFDSCSPRPGQTFGGEFTERDHPSIIY